MFIEVGVGRLGERCRSSTMANADITARPTELPNIDGSMGRVIVTQDNPPVATFSPWLQMLLQKVYDVTLAIAALRRHCQCEPVGVSATAEKLLQAFVDGSISLKFEHTFNQGGTE